MGREAFAGHSVDSHPLLERGFPDQRPGRDGASLPGDGGVFVDTRHELLAHFFSFFGVALASCVLPFAWYVAAYRQGGEEFLQLVLEENVLRFLGKMSYESHENPAYYNVVTVLAGYVPYTLLVLISLFALKYRKVQAKPREWWGRLKAYIRTMDDTRLFSLLSIVIIFVFYCIPKSKRSVYLLPIYPFIAYFLAEYILYLVRVRPVVMKIFGSIMASVSILLLLVFFRSVWDGCPIPSFQVVTPKKTGRSCMRWRRCRWMWYPGF